MQDGVCILFPFVPTLVPWPPSSPVPLVNEDRETLLLKTSSTVPRRQKVAFPGYSLLETCFHSSGGSTPLPGAGVR